MARHFCFDADRYGSRGVGSVRMKRFLAVIAATLSLAWLNGCDFKADSDDGGVSSKFGSDYFGAGGVLNVIDPIPGDAFMAGGNVTIASEIEDDLVVAGGDVSVGGSVGDDVYVAGGNVSLDALVEGNARVAGGDVSVGPATVIDGSAALTGGRVEFDGTTKGNLKAAGGHVRINGTVDGDVEVGAEHLTIGPETRVTGTLFYHGPEQPEVPPGAVIAGGVKFRETHAHDYMGENGGTVRDTASVAGSIVWFLGSFLVAALFAIAFPDAARRGAEYIGREPAKALGLGLAMLIAIPVFVALVAITIIGIPLALLMIPVYLLLLFLGWVTTAMFLGQKGLSYVRTSQPVTRGWAIAALFVALIALSLLKRVPVIGSWIGFFALIAGVGGLVRYVWSQRDARGAVPA
jgi:hypothetical protein